MGPEYATLLELLVRGPGRAAGRRAFQRGRRLAAGPRFRHARPDPRRPRRPKPRSCCARVSGRRRTEPPHRAGRAARAHGGAADAPAQGAPRPRARASTSPRSCCSPRATAPRSTRDATQFHAGDRRRPRLPRRAARASTPTSFADHLYTYYDDAAVAHLFGGRRRPRLDDHRRGRDPRPGARGVAGRRARGHGRPAARRARSATRSRSASGPAPRPASAATRCRSRRPRSRSPPSASARSTAAACSCSAPARWARAWRSRCVGRRRRARSWSPTAPRARADELAARRRRARRSRSTRSPTRSSTCDVLLASTGATEVLVERGDIETVMARRDGAPLLVVDVARAPRRRSRASARCSA